MARKKRWLGGRIGPAFLFGFVSGFPAPKYVEVPRFDAIRDANRSRDFFDDHGFVVFRAAASAELKTGWDLFWQYLEGLGTGIDRRRPSTWGEARWPMSHQEIGLMVFFGIGQSDFMWYLRGLPHVKAAFAALWGTDDLLVSFDGSVVFRTQDPTLVPTDGYWWHVDQSPRLMPNADCVQGILAMTASDPDVGGLVLVDGSHRHFPSFYEQRYGGVLDLAPQALNYFSIPRWDPEAHAHLAGHAVQPHLEAGDLIVWDSRTLHCSRVGRSFGRSNRTARSDPVPDGAGLGGHVRPAAAAAAAAVADDAPPPMRHRPVGPGEQTASRSQPPSMIGPQGPERVGALITMTPRSKASAETLLHRRHAVCQGTTTTHWPHRFVDAQVHNIQNWESMSTSWRNRFRRPSPPRLSEAQLRLVGYSDPDFADLLGGQGMDLRAVLCPGWHGGSA